MMAGAPSEPNSFAILGGGLAMPKGEGGKRDMKPRDHLK